MPTITIPCNAGAVSDGYHTFDELYEHRSALFLALMKFNPAESWFSRCHHDGTCIGDGWFISGMTLPTGETVTYHMPMGLWVAARLTGARLMRPPEWDGHTSKDVVQRLMNFACNATPANSSHQPEIAPMVPAEPTSGLRAHVAFINALADAQQPKKPARPISDCPKCGEFRGYDHVCPDGTVDGGAM